MNIPKHIAFIMDGNGRWAKAQGKTRTHGHKAGFRNLVHVLNDCKDLGVDAVTCYAFSTENWNRPKKEIDYLMEIPSQIYRENGKEFVTKKIKVKFIGRRDRIPAAALDAIENIERDTKDFTDFTVVIAFDYGSYEELTTTIKKVTTDAINNTISLEDVNPELIDRYLYTNGLPKIDLLVRTSGEQRLSNYLLWQLAYSELYFTDTYWPAFKKDDLLKAINEYNRRNRRFGSIKEA
ncbi:polyprenyl diphosphate synthase [Mycoplasmatota bacterium WC44]